MTDIEIERMTLCIAQMAAILEAGDRAIGRPRGDVEVYVQRRMTELLGELVALRTGRERWQFIRQYMYVEHREQGPQVCLQHGYFPSYPQGETIEAIIDAALAAQRTPEGPK